MVISTPPRFGIAFSPSPRLCAVCDVGFGNNKWLDVFGCHVKPGEGHVLSEHAIATREGGRGPLGSKVWVFGCTQSDSSCMGTVPDRSVSLVEEDYVQTKGFFLKIFFHLFY